MVKWMSRKCSRASRAGGHRAGPSGPSRSRSPVQHKHTKAGIQLPRSTSPPACTGRARREANLLLLGQADKRVLVAVTTATIRPQQDPAPSRATEPFQQRSQARRSRFTGRLRQKLDSGANYSKPMIREDVQETKISRSLTKN